MQQDRHSNSHFTPFLDTIIDTTGIGLWDWDLTSGKVIYSRQWEAIAGYEEGTLPQTVESWENALLPEDLAHAEKEIERHLSGELPRYEAEFRMRRPDGSVIWAQDRGVVTDRDGAGKALRLVGVLQDVTRLKETELALKEKSDQLDFVASMCGLGMWDWHLPSSTISYNNDYLEMMGYTQEEINGSLAEWETFNHPEDIIAVNKALDDYLTEKAPSYSIETRMRHKDGHYIWTLDTGRIVDWDKDGNPVRVLGGHLNIDMLKRAELTAQKALRENEVLRQQLEKDLTASEEFRRTLFEASPYVSVIFDEDLHLVDCNPVAVEYFGFKDRDDLLENLIPLISASIPDFQPDGTKSRSIAQLFRAAIQKGEQQVEGEIDLQGEATPVRCVFKKVPYMDSYAVAVYLIDLKSLKQARSELEHQDMLLQAVNEVARELMGAATESFDDAVWQSMGTMAKAVGAQRMYV